MMMMHKRTILSLAAYTSILLWNFELIHTFPTSAIPQHASSNIRQSDANPPFRNCRNDRTQLDMARSKRINNLMDWAKTKAGIQVTESLTLQDTPDTGIGWHVGSRAMEPGSLLMTVPAKTALTVECPGSGPADASVKVDNKNWPWYVQMAVYLYSLQQHQTTTTSKMDYTTWLEALPQSFNTPIHWSSSSLAELQYKPMETLVKKQVESWTAYYQSVQKLYPNLTKDDFIYWCEISRSRGFSGSYGGAAFNPAVYAFTLLLVTVYVGLNLGTLEQAANGAGVVFSVSVLKDFVVPKFFKTKRYCICPMIDMANHKSADACADVSFEYFGNAYSLAVTKPQPANSELFISYGDRSNDQLLQYYGFVEVDNPHDVYSLPPIREWDLSALEAKCGRSVAAGRLADMATALRQYDEMGVVLTRSSSIDPSAMQTIRALFATEQEWSSAGSSVGPFQDMVNPDNEACARKVVAAIVEQELSEKPTSAEEDAKIPKKNLDSDELLAIQFRMEKKKLLQEQLQAFHSL